jgi:threonine dehydrogenase-like Zn-dependent dehydrogenase
LSSCSLPVNMPAVRLHGPYDLRVDQVPTPSTPGLDEALIRVTATGICGGEFALNTTYDDEVVKIVIAHETG